MSYNVTGLGESRGGLFMGLRPMREHAITHRDACNLSSLKEMSTLDIFMS